MKPGQRLLFAFAVSPLATLPITTAVVALWWGYEIGLREMVRGGLEGLGSCAAIGLIALMVAYPIMLVVGVPLSLILRKLNLFQPREMKLIGGLVGTLPFLPMTASAIYSNYEGSLANALMYLIAGILSGSVSAWLVWRISSGGSRSPEVVHRPEGGVQHAHRPL